jgi:rhodanese-related sulfurtransferase
LSTVREVDQATFVTAHASGVFVIDVREGFEYVAGHVSGALLIPMGQLAARVNELPRDRPVYVICASGNRSLTAAAYLTRAGVDAWSVAGGTTAWQRAGRPTVAGALAG